jgi:hypothetical protein
MGFITILMKMILYLINPFYNSVKPIDVNTNLL